tara:strand:+ start:15995 stop:16159 length:165 start_codon:yes stop_codon:yes gene_type:complete
MRSPSSNKKQDKDTLLSATENPPVDVTGGFFYGHLQMQNGRDIPPVLAIVLSDC